MSFDTDSDWGKQQLIRLNPFQAGRSLSTTEKPKAKFWLNMS